MSAASRRSSVRSRRPVKQDAVAAALRAEIIDGKYPSGTQLPPHLALAKHFQVSVLTVQMGLNRLVREGFLQSRARQGMFVTENLPHLTNYALVFWNDPREPSQWSKYYAALTSAAAEIQRTEGRHIAFFHGVDQHGDTEDFQRLMDMMSAHRLAGMIFANQPGSLIGSPLLEEPGVPRVAIMGQPFPSVPAVAYGSTLERALDYLCARGRQRIAIISIEMDEAHDRELADSLTRRGLTAPARWRQVLSRLDAFGARHCVELLLHGPAADRPDALIIRDDNLVEHALAGLVATGLKVPQDIEVVTHCNFPWPTASVLPVKRLGFDMQDTLRACITLIDRQRRGESVPDMTTLPAVFEEELESASPASMHYRATSNM